MATSMNTPIPLSSGKTIPALGFGLWASEDPTESIKLAVKNGYRHLDSARHYKNEKQVGEAIRQLGIPREEFFLTSKVWYTDHGSDITPTAIDESFERLGGYWDLYLLHTPQSGKEKRIEAYKALVDAQAAGKVKTIGVSNFNPTHIQQLIEAGLPKPSVNQIELHPFCQQKPIVEYCKANDIVIEAYCPIARGKYFDNPVIQQVSQSTKRTPSQVMIRWCVQKGYIPLPKSDKEHRMVENASVFNFEISAEDMSKLDALDLGGDGAVAPNPVSVP